MEDEELFHVQKSLCHFPEDVQDFLERQAPSPPGDQPEELQEVAIGAIFHLDEGVLHPLSLNLHLLLPGFIVPN